MSANLPPTITVNRNLASTLKNYIKQNGGKQVSESEINSILQKVAKFDAERDAGTRAGGSIFSGGHKYLGGTGKDFVVKQGQQIQLSAEEFNEIFKGFIDPIGTQPAAAAPVETTTSQPTTTTPPETTAPQPQTTTAPEVPTAAEPEVAADSAEEQTQQTVQQTEQNIVDKQAEENEIRSLLGLADDAQIPEGITLHHAGDTPFLKKDGEVIDFVQLCAYATQNPTIEAQGGALAGLTPAGSTTVQADETILETESEPEIKPEMKTKTSAVQPKMSDKELNRYLAKDSQYQKYDKYMQALEREMNRMEEEYGFACSRDANGHFGLSRSNDKESSVAEMNEYFNYYLEHEELTNSLAQYKEEMTNWRDGMASKTVDEQTGKIWFENRITLKNGQRAWMTEQGVFYPGQDGQVGSDKVPENLIPRKYKSKSETKPEAKIETRATQQITTEEELKEYLTKDSQYQKFDKYKQALRKEIDKLEVDIRSADKATKEKYIVYTGKFYGLEGDLEDYKKEMMNWRDGLASEIVADTGETVTFDYRITLKNGQRAWLTESGVYYPGSNGKVSLSKVPENLIPDKYKSEE